MPLNHHAALAAALDAASPDLAVFDRFYVEEALAHAVRALRPRAVRVLLHAGASGVGTAGIQLCKTFGNPCYVTAGSDEKIARCVELGAQGGTNRHSENFAERVAEWTGGKGFGGGRVAFVG